MAVTESNQLELGTTAPHFALDDTEGALVCIDDFWASKALVVMFVSNSCPYVRHVRSEISKLALEYEPRGVAFVAIMPNPFGGSAEEDREAMRREQEEAGYPFPYLHDASQNIAKSYRAACTPEFYLFDASRSLVYRGQLDDSRPGNDVPVTGADLRAALDALLDGGEISAEQRPATGCGIKWA